MSVRILSIGRFKHSFLSAGEDEYLKRLKPHLKIAVSEVATKAESNAETQLAREGELVLSSLKPGEFLVALDERGAEMTSQQLATKLERWMANPQGLTFLIGGAYGLSKEVLKRANVTLSLSQMTFTYQFARLLLIEQLYRAITLQKGISYHK